MKWPVAGGNGLPGTAGTRLVFPDSFEPGLRRIFDYSGLPYRDILLSKHTARRDDHGHIIGTVTITLFGLHKTITNNPYDKRVMDMVGPNADVATQHAAWLRNAKEFFGITDLLLTTDVHNHNDTRLRLGGPFYIEPAPDSTPTAVLVAPTPKATRWLYLGIVTASIAAIIGRGIIGTRK
jgi:hypothetical protein